MPQIRFRIEFGGRFPEHYPHALTIPAPTAERAAEWAQKQLETWGVDVKKVTLRIQQVVDAKPAVEVPEKEDKDTQPKLEKNTKKKQTKSEDKKETKKKDKTEPVEKKKVDKKEAKLRKGEKKS
jgi:hypothetical protein